jgi:acyl-coenzyme A thioesterase PaaI-like protein
VLKRGGRVVFAEAEITDANDGLIAKASGTEVPVRA